MKKILITGADSYIGVSFENWLKQYGDSYSVNTVSTMPEEGGAEWEKTDFSQYDTVFHVAGIAHIKETSSNTDLYYRVNRDLTVEIAKKSKEQGIKHFVLLSSMSVFGLTVGIIDKNTKALPNTNYGKSKLQADELIISMSSPEFIVSIIRPPMVYGDGCKGNYQSLRKIALKSPIFPTVRNSRSMIYIGNLCEFIRLLISEPQTGFYYPQNKEYVSSSEMVQLIAQSHNKKTVGLGLFNFFFRKIPVPVFKKVFGDLLYDKSLSAHYGCSYCVFDFKETILISEGVK